MTNRTNNIFSNNSSSNNLNKNIFNNSSNQYNMFNNNSNQSSNNSNTNIFTNKNNGSTNNNQGSNLFNNNSQKDQNNSNQSSNNIFSNNNSNNSNNPNNNYSTRSNNNSNSQNTNIFNNSQNNRNNISNNGQTHNIFSNNNQSNQLFNNITNNSTNNLFNNNNNNNNNSNNLFNNNNNNNSNNIFNNNNNNGNNLFNNNNNRNNQGYNFLKNNQGNNLNVNYFGSNLNNQAYAINAIRCLDINSLSNQDQNTLYNCFRIQSIKNIITECKRSLDPRNLENIKLSSDNLMKKERIGKLGNQNLQFKKELIKLKHSLKTNILEPIKQLKNKQKQLEKLSNDFSSKVFQKLQIYKNRLMESISHSKMIGVIKEQIEQIQNEIKDCLYPIQKAFQKDITRNYNFQDPNEFCIKISRKILKNMNKLDSKMDQLLSCEEQTQDTIDTGEVIEQLIQYYQNLAISLKQFCDNYTKAKEKTLPKNESLKKISEKATMRVNKEFQVYQLIKQIQGLLEQRDKKYEEMIKQ